MWGTLYFIVSQIEQQNRGIKYSFKTRNLPFIIFVHCFSFEFVFGQAFVEVCAKHGNMKEAMKYLVKVSPEQKVKCLVKVG